MTISNRFNGSDGQNRLIEELCSQSIVRGKKEIAEQIAKLGQLISVAPSEEIISQGGSDNDIYFIISGEFHISINKRVIATRGPHQHVGEMAMIDSAASRSATATATTSSVVVRLSEANFSKLANAEPSIWRLLARDLSIRLRERSRFIKEPNLHPHVFIGCSSEYLKTAESFQQMIASDSLTVNLWTDGIFQLSSSALESLYKTTQQMDIAIIILGPDDKLEFRDNFYSSPRDNVVFELGLFMGSLGPERTIFIAPKDSDFKIPTDLVGITHIKVICDGAAKEIPETELKKAASTVLSHTAKLGVK